MNTKTISTTKSIASCGLNCGICVAYLRDKNKCPGCMAGNEDKPKTRSDCKIKNCGELKKNDSGYCFSCAIFPCARIKHLDERYRRKYDVSSIENLESIRKSGIRKFIENEKVRWACPECGGTVCAHKGCCIDCGAKRRVNAPGEI